MHSTNEMINDIFATANHRGILNPNDFQILMTAITTVQDSESQQVITRLLYSIRRGWIRIA
jgi:hypothetical protein